MPLSDLTDTDKTMLAEVLRETIAADRFPMSSRVRRLKAILAKLDPHPEPPVIPYPPPLPSAEPSFLYAKLRGVRRRR